jgi:hypothetical protein
MRVFPNVYSAYDWIFEEMSDSYPLNITEIMEHVKYPTDRYRHQTLKKIAWEYGAYDIYDNL